MDGPDLGDPTQLPPDNIEALRRLVLAAITEQDWAAARAGFGDPDLADN